MTTHSKDIRKQLADILEMYKNYVVRNSTNKFALTQEQAIEDIESLLVEARIDELKWVLKQDGNVFVGNGENEIKWSARNRIAQLSNKEEKK